MKKRFLLIGIIFGLIFITAILVFVPVVPDEHTAKIIAIVAVQWRYPELNMSDFSIIVSFISEKNIWVVDFLSKYDPPDTIGGGLEVIIDKKTGRIISMLFGS